MAPPRCRLYVTRDRGWAWVVLAAAFVSQGLCSMYAIVGLFNVIFLDVFEQSAVITAWLTGIHSALVSLMGPVASVLMNRYGVRVSLCLGGGLACSGFFLTFFARTMAGVFVTYGLMAGAGLGIVFTTATTIPSIYFRKYRDFAAGISCTGLAVGMCGLTSLIQHVTEAYGWRGCLLIMAGLTGHIFVAAAVVRPLREDGEMVVETVVVEGEEGVMQKEGKDGEEKLILLNGTKGKGKGWEREEGVVQKEGKDGEEKLIILNRAKDKGKGWEREEGVLQKEGKDGEEKLILLNGTTDKGRGREREEKEAKEGKDEKEKLILLNGTTDKGRGREREKEEKDERGEKQNLLSGTKEYAKEEDAVGQKEKKQHAREDGYTDLSTSHSCLVTKFPHLNAHSNNINNNAARPPSADATSKPSDTTSELFNITENSDATFDATPDSMCSNAGADGSAENPPDITSTASLRSTQLQSHSTTTNKSFHFEIFRSPSYLTFCLYLMLVNIGVSIFFTFVPVMAITHGTAAGDAGFLIAVAGVVGVGARVGIGAVANFAPVHIFVLNSVTSLLCGVIMLQMPYNFSTYLEQLAGVIAMGVVVVSVFILMPGSCIEILDVSLASSAIGTGSFMYGIGFLIGPPMGGLLYDITGHYEYAFVFAGICYVMGSVLTGLMFVCHKLRSTGRTGETEKHLEPAPV